MIKALGAFLMLALATPVLAQDVPRVDVTAIVNHPKIDLSRPLPLLVQQAIAAAEDRSYFDSFPATSPITRALGRNMLLTSQSTLTRRIEELQLGIDIANAFSAQDILTMYGQTIYLGARCYGFEDALSVRLNTTIDDASLRDVLTLAALIRGPAFYEDPDRLQARFDFLITEGQQQGFWTTEQIAPVEIIGPSPISDAICPLE